MKNSRKGGFCDMEKNVRGSVKLLFYAFESLFEVFEDVVNVFCADGKTDGAL